MDINTDQDCSWAMDPDIVLSSISVGSDATVSPGGCMGHSDQHYLGARWPLDHNMAPGGVPDPRHLRGF